MSMKYLRLIFFALTWGLALTLTITFFIAFSSAEKSVTIYVNNSGEAIYEAILCPLIMFGSLWSIMNELRKIGREK